MNNDYFFETERLAVRIMHSFVPNAVRDWRNKWISYSKN